MQTQSNLDSIFAALADPTRRAILARLALGEATVGEIAAPLPMTQPAVSRHLAVLESAGLVEQSRRGTARPRRLRCDRLGPATEWLENIRDIWEERFRQLDVLLETLRQEDGNAHRDPQT